MEKIKSFTIDHTKLIPGFYISREDGNIITYDLRTCKPNGGSYMDNRTMHSFEHMFATFARNSDIKDNVIYFGPMGCQTGFYFIVKDESPQKVLQLTKDILDAILIYEGEVFGCSAKECGQYRNLSLAAAKRLAAKYKIILDDWTDTIFTYPE